jgi:LacI family transcriptional regulator
VQRREGKATINDVADLAGVSKKTVSRVINRSPLLNDATREKVEAVIAQLGYVPNPQARALALRRNFLIGLVHDNPNAQTVLTVQQGVLEAIRDTEFALVVRPINRRSPTLLDDIRHFIEQQRLFGVFILPPISEIEALPALCRELGCNYVRMGSARLDDVSHLVESNDRQAVASAVSHLIAQGHRRIGFVAGPQGFRSAYEREQGYRDALSAHGIAIDPALMAGGNYTFETGMEAGRILFARDERPSAIFSSNDEMAAGIVHAAHEAGLDVPRDVSLIGFDDTPIAAHMWPPLTTVRWPIKAMAHSAALKLIHPERAAEEVAFFESETIHRASVAPFNM